MVADQHEHERERLLALDKYDVLDTPPEETFDRITRLVTRLFRVPIATINLIDGHRQWFKSRRGLTSTEVERGPGLCNVAIREGRALVVPDTHLDERFAQNPFVIGEPFVRFYAGAPLRTPDGHNIGTICAMDTRAHEPDPGLVDALSDLSRIVIDELELRALMTSDPLTGAMTRRAFREQGARMLALAQRHRNDLSCLAVNLDRLGAVNEAQGPERGDAVLAAVAATIRRTLRKSDVLARIGGDEFAVLLPHTGRSSASKVAEKLRAAVARGGGQDQDLPLVTVSVGIASMDRSIPDLQTLLDRARAGLASAKADGGNRCAESQPASSAAPDVRRRVFKAGKIVFNAGRSAIDCTVRTLSDKGAGFDVISSAGVPESFKLNIEADNLSRLCNVVAKSERHIEVEFA